MNNKTAFLKVQQRINKLASADYDNIQPWQFIESFNKAQVEWVRRQLEGINQTKTGDEASKRRVDDLNILLTTLPLTLTHYKNFDQSTTLPSYPSGNAYLEYKSIDLTATKECCEGEERSMQVYQGEEANVTWYLTDDNKKPSFDWGETFMTMYNGKVRIYTNNDFKIKSAKLMYYRQPRGLQMLNVRDPYSGNLPAKEVICEFKDDICELLCDDTASIIAGDIENFQQMQRNQMAAERNN